MRLALRRRPDLEPIDAPLEDPAPVATGGHQAASTWSTRFATAGLFICLALGPVGAVAGIGAIMHRPEPASSGPAVVADQSNERAIAGEFAQRVVVAWLTATRDNADALNTLVKNVHMVRLPEKGFEVAEPAVARVVDVDGTWSVTIAATVTDARGEAARRYYQVPVTVSGDVVAALTLPAIVSPPIVGQATSREYRTNIDSSSPVGVTVRQFLAAYIAGAGDVSRYMTPGVALTAVQPAPFTGVQLDDLRATADIDTRATPPDGQRLQLLVAATAVVTDQQNSTLEYALTLTARAGRWEITAIDQAPVLEPKTPADQSTQGVSGPAPSANSGTSTTTP